jgi:TonB family protein
MLRPAAFVLAVLFAGHATGPVMAQARTEKDNSTFPEAKLQALVGQSARICGMVVEYLCRPKRDKDSQLDLGTQASEPGLSIRIPIASRARFGLAFEGRTLARNVCATGPISRVDHRFFVQIEDPSALSVEAREEPAPPPPDLVSPCDEGVTMPMVRREEKPKYTRAALEAGIKGVVWMDTIVGVDGKPGSIRLIRSLDQRFGLDQEAVKALQQWRFSPARYEGRDVPIRVVVEMYFTLKR